MLKILPLEVLFVENVQSHSVKVCKKMQMNVNLNDCTHVRVKKAIKSGRRGLLHDEASTPKSAGGETCSQQSLISNLNLSFRLVFFPTKETSFPQP